MALTDVKIRQAKPSDKAFKLADEKGLYLLVTPQGSKLWKFKYRFAQKEKKLSLGAYPDVSLADARAKRDKARSLLARDVDPGLLKQVNKRATKIAAETSFEHVTREWYVKHSTQWKPSHGERILRRFERDLFPWIGPRPIAEISAPELLAVLRRIEDRGSVETAHRALQNCGQVFRYAVATGRAERDPSGDLRGALAPPKQSHFASLTDPKEIGALLRAINGYQGHFPTVCALRLAPLVFVRPGELRNAEWSEFDLDKSEWRIPGEKMKMNEKHIIPLSTQALAILKELHPLTGHGQYLFPSVRTPKRPMSENTLNGALRRLGYTTSDMTAHGFRSMACTLLNEQGCWNRDAIERQLAHSERNSVRAAYNYAEHLPERREMMQWWSDHLEGLMSGAMILNIKVS
ncbi:MAG: tyrosine-type recombinase/integrase [Gammaproteobacteria bacterium]